MSKFFPGAPTRCSTTERAFTYSPNGQKTSLTDARSNTTNPDERLIWIDATQGTVVARYPHANKRGETIAIAKAGTEDVHYVYGAFGESTDASGGYPWRYTGQRLNEWTGLYHYKARAYSPTLGRFLQPDYVGYNDGPNIYAYVGNNPYALVDTTGQAATLYWSASNKVEIQISAAIERHDGATEKVSEGEIEVHWEAAFTGVTNIDGVDINVTADMEFGPNVEGSAVSQVDFNVVPQLPDPDGDGYRNAYTDKVGGNEVYIDPSKGADTTTHECGHCAGAGDQYNGGIDVNGNRITGGVGTAPRPGQENSVMGDKRGKASPESLKQILTSGANKNVCASGVRAANGKC